jgi:HSP20 family protein
VADRNRRKHASVAAERPAPLERVERLVRLRGEAERIARELARIQAGRPSGATGLRVPADVYQVDDHFLVSFELPGIAREDVSLQVVGSCLVVEGRKSEDTATTAGERVAYECAERTYGSFHRMVELPGAADTSHVTARLEGGVLAVRLPRIGERRGRKREVTIG